jgi:CheY-like chemotaxis protein
MKGKILFVEDTYAEPIETDPYYAGLVQEGYEVTMATDGDKAWQLLSDDPYCCIILDLMLPKGSGPHFRNDQPPYRTGIFLLENVKRGEFPKNNINSVIVASAIADLRELENILKLYPVHYLEKPFFPEDLIEVVEAVANQKVADSAGA